MLAALYTVLAGLYVPVLWLLAVFHAVVGLMGLVAPKKLRGLMGALASKGRIRVLGALLLVLGAMVFIGADHSELPRLGKFLAVLFFVDGGVRLVMPVVSVVYTEALMGLADAALRGLAVALLILAAFFYMAAKTPPEPTEQPTIEAARQIAVPDRLSI